MSMAILYSELRDDIAAVAHPLFELSAKLLRELDNFLPHGYVLVDAGKDRMVGVQRPSPDGSSTSVEILPLLHQGLREQVRAGNVRAVGVAENVTAIPEDGAPTMAIKVLFEHREGLCVALYRPYQKDPEHGSIFGEDFTVAAAPEIYPEWMESSELKGRN